MLEISASPMVGVVGFAGRKAVEENRSLEACRDSSVGHSAELYNVVRLYDTSQGAEVGMVEGICRFVPIV